MRSPALITACSKAGCYAVLASLSGRYPPFEGRSPTCYSPVRHSTQDRSPFRVRLACVRHAASVDSEPGSNSHVKFAVPPSRLAALRRDNCLTRSPVENGSCVVSYSLSIWWIDASASTASAFRPPQLQLTPNPLTLDGLVACTLYLVFKEPDLFPAHRSIFHRV